MCYEHEKLLVTLVLFVSNVQGSIVGRELGERLSIRRDKNHILFGGTKILQHTGDKVTQFESMLEESKNVARDG
jgi:hypothetical protein